MIDRTPSGRAVLDGAVVDAEMLSLPWPDPAAQWGLGVFETVAVHEGSPRHLAAHLVRLNAAAERFGVPLPPAADLIRACGDVAAGASEGLAWLKVVVSRSGRWTVFSGPLPPGAAARPVSAVVLPWRRHREDPAVGIKTTGYADAMLGLEEAARRGADEGLWLNDRGHLIGACTANVFVVRGRAAITPRVSDGARDGVMRELAIGMLREAGIAVHEAKLRTAALRAAHEVFLTSSLSGVRPVVTLDGRPVRGGQPGPVTRAVAERWSDTGGRRDA